MIDTLHIKHYLTKKEYETCFKELRTFLQRSRLNAQFRRDNRDKRAYLTNVFSKIGLQEIRLRSLTHGKYSIEIRLRPQLLINPEGYYKLTLLTEFQDVECSFDYVLRDCFNLPVPSLRRWRVQRIDSALDLLLDTELIPLYIRLFKKGNLPDMFMARKAVLDYWDSETNVYLISSNVTVNWYDRYHTLKIKDEKSGGKYADFSETSGIFRFETQVKDCNMGMHSILDYKFLKSKVMHFYEAIVGKADYYSFSAAINKLNQSVHAESKRIKLIRLLYLLNDSGGVYEAKKRFMKQKLYKSAADTFSKRIRQLIALGINPVLLPEDCGIDHLENLHSRIENQYKKMRRPY